LSISLPARCRLRGQCITTLRFALLHLPGLFGGAGLIYFKIKVKLVGSVFFLGFHFVKFIANNTGCIVQAAVNWTFLV
jgi:hypothetical protein